MEKEQEQKKSEKFEKVVKRIYELLSPDCKVTHDEKIMGAQSKALRQVDVSIRGVVGGHKIFIVVECKDTKKKVDIAVVDAFCTKLKDVCANKGVLVCNSGFSSSARRLAKNNGIELCKIHDAEEKDWRLELKIPVIWEEVNPTIACKLIMEFKEQVNANNFNIKPQDCSVIGGVDWFPQFKKDWESGAIPLDNDEYVYSPDIRNPSIKFSNAEEVPLKRFALEMHFKRSYYLGFFDDLPTAKALKNEMDGEVQKLIFASDVQGFNKTKLIYISSVDKLAIDPKTHIRILLRPNITNWFLKAYSADGPSFHMRREMSFPISFPRNIN